MIELPEATALSAQITKQLKGKKIKNVIAMHTPHKLVWTFKDPSKYNNILKGKVIEEARPLGSMVEISCGKAKIVLSEGFNIRYFENTSEVPEKHQLMVTFEDGSCLAAWVQMYGGLACFTDNEYDNKYYLIAQKKPSPFSKKFNLSYWNSLFTPETEKISAKAFLATEQRIPGLGNGVLQDILFNAKIHPKQKIVALSSEDRKKLYTVIVSTLEEMISKGGRDTEKDLQGNPGRYQTKMSTKTVGTPCPNCGTNIKKLAYMGGSVYVCETCQKSPLPSKKA